VSGISPPASLDNLVGEQQRRHVSAPCLAVLIASSYQVGASMGSSAGFAPFRMRSTQSAARQKMSFRVRTASVHRSSRMIAAGRRHLAVFRLAMQVKRRAFQASGFETPCSPDTTTLTA